jgi:hypothetical protein
LWAIRFLVVLIGVLPASVEHWMNICEHTMNMGRFGDILLTLVRDTAVSTDARWGVHLRATRPSRPPEISKGKRVSQNGVNKPSIWAERVRSRRSNSRPVGRRWSIPWRCLTSAFLAQEQQLPAQKAMPLLRPSHPEPQNTDSRGMPLRGPCLVISIATLPKLRKCKPHCPSRL